MKLHIRHTTTFSYSQPLLYTVQNLHLWPVSGPTQRVDAWELDVPGLLVRQPDVDGNRVHSFTCTSRPEQDTRQLQIRAQGTVQTFGVHEFTDAAPALPPAFYRRPSPLAEPHPRMALWALQVVPSLMARLVRAETLTLPDVLPLARAVSDKVRHRPSSGQAEDTTALEAFDWELGDSQDQAHVLVAVCRSIGLPARFVSGWCFGEQASRSAPHAWVDICVDEPANRWVSLDPGHSCAAGERHVRLAAGPDRSACQAVCAHRAGGGAQQCQVRVQMTVLD